MRKIIAPVAIQGALRISEVVMLEYEDVTLLNNGSMSMHIKSSKTDQAAQGTVSLLLQIASQNFAV